VRPCICDQKIRMAPAIFRSFRSVFGMGRPRAPSMIASASSALVFSAAALSMAGRPSSDPIAAEHQSVEHGILETVSHVVTCYSR
jgi:hypothetical protein